MTGRTPIPPRVWQLDTASLSDANKALRVLPRELRPYTHGVRMVGRAVTIAASGTPARRRAACVPGPVPPAIGASGAENAATTAASTPDRASHATT